MTALFEVSTGISIDGQISFLYGTTLPSSDPQATTAPIGSTYSNTVTGVQYTRKANTGAATDWAEESTVENAIKALNVGATGVTLDSVLVVDHPSFAWQITVESTLFATTNMSFILTASHDGNGVALATQVKHAISNRLIQGGMVGVIAEARLSGTTLSTQKLELFITTAMSTNITVSRISRGLSGTLVTTAINTAQASRGLDIYANTGVGITAGQEITRMVMVRPTVFKADLPSTVSIAVVAPLTDVTLSIRKNGVTFATLNYLAGYQMASVNAPTGTEFLSGDVLTLVSDSTDATFARSVTTLVGQIVVLNACDHSTYTPTPVVNASMMFRALARDWYVNADFNGSVAVSATAPTLSPVVYHIDVNGVTVNTITFAVGSTQGVFGISSIAVYGAQSILEVYATSTNAAQTKVVITLAGTTEAI